MNKMLDETKKNDLNYKLLFIINHTGNREYIHYKSILGIDNNCFECKILFIFQLSGSGLFLKGKQYFYKSRKNSNITNIKILKFLNLTGKHVQVK